MFHRFRFCTDSIVGVGPVGYYSVVNGVWCCRIYILRRVGDSKTCNVYHVCESSCVNVLRCVLLLMVVGAVIYSGTVDISF